MAWAMSSITIEEGTQREEDPRQVWATSYQAYPQSVSFLRALPNTAFATLPFAVSLPMVSPSFAPTMTAPPAKRRKHHSSQTPRPVFLAAALRRVMRQPTWRARLRAYSVIASLVLTDAAWWLRSGIWYVPNTLRAARERTIVRIHHNIPCPSLEIYVPKQHTEYLRICLATVSCASAPPTAASAGDVPAAPVVVYVHGGAWGAGNASHYSQLAVALTKRVGSTVLVVSYRLYPQALMDHQAADVTAALQYARRVFPHRRLVALAHSSGAHLVALASMRAALAGEEPLADAVVLAAAPLHLMHHFMFEARRGVADVSPMLPAACAESDAEQFDVRSPSVLAENFEGSLREVDGLEAPPAALEGDLAATNVYLPVARPPKEDANCVNFSRTYIITSSCDTVVPMYSSIRFAAALRNVGLKCKLLVYDGAGHGDFVTDWFAGASPRDLSNVLDISEGDLRRRIEFLARLKGTSSADLVSDREKELGPTPYVRDVVRILQSLTMFPLRKEDGV